MEKKITCPVCKKENSKFNPNVGMYICPDCGHEWTDESPKPDKAEEQELGTGD